MECRDLISTTNLFIIIIDGLRWHEVFNGPDPALLNNKTITPDATIKRLFWDEAVTERRKRLLPFFWDVIAKHGQLLGDRNGNSKVNAANPYSISYAGYNEIFTGKASSVIMRNKKKLNRNINVLEYLNNKPAFASKMAVFSSWNGMPYVLNNKRNGILIDGGYEDETEDKIKLPKNMTREEDKKSGQLSPETRYDTITYERAKKYLRDHHPRILVVAFAEGDVHGHQKRYDLYLKEAHNADSRIAELWALVQNDPYYKDQTNFLITTDHGRGSKTTNWYDHGLFVKGSTQTWMGLMGPHIQSLKLEKKQFYNKELAGIIARLVGEEFTLS